MKIALIRIGVVVFCVAFWFGIYQLYRVHINATDELADWRMHQSIHEKLNQQSTVFYDKSIAETYREEDN